MGTSSEERIDFDKLSPEELVELTYQKSLAASEREAAVNPRKLTGNHHVDDYPEERSGVISDIDQAAILGHLYADKIKEDKGYAEGTLGSFKAEMVGAGEYLRSSLGSMYSRAAETLNNGSDAWAEIEKRGYTLQEKLMKDVDPNDQAAWWGVQVQVATSVITEAAIRSGKDGIDIVGTAITDLKDIKESLPESQRSAIDKGLIALGSAYDKIEAGAILTAEKMYTGVTQGIDDYKGAFDSVDERAQAIAKLSPENRQLVESLKEQGASHLEVDAFIVKNNLDEKTPEIPVTTKAMNYLKTAGVFVASKIGFGDWAEKTFDIKKDSTFDTMLAVVENKSRIQSVVDEMYKMNDGLNVEHLKTQVTAVFDKKFDAVSPVVEEAPAATNNGLPAGTQVAETKEAAPVVEKKPVQVTSVEGAQPVTDLLGDVSAAGTNGRGGFDSGVTLPPTPSQNASIRISS